MISIIKTKKNPSPMKLMITELILYSKLMIITKVPTKHIIPQTRGNKYRKESSIATLAEIIYIFSKDWFENQGKN